MISASINIFSSLGLLVVIFHCGFSLAPVFLFVADACALSRRDIVMGMARRGKSIQVNASSKVRYKGSSCLLPLIPSDCQGHSFL